MVYTLEGKIALITGGASGVGFEYAKALLRCGCGGVTLADVNETVGQKSLEYLTSVYGLNRAIFVRTDVTKIKQLEDAFKKTVNTFGHIDIVFNNAGILNDAIWEKQVSINVNGVIHGMLLAIEKYLPQHHQEHESVIVNISSIAGVIGSAHVPVYSATKHAIIGITRSWGQSAIYKKYKVRVIAVCPGMTETPMISEVKGRSLGDFYEENIKDVEGLPVQKPEELAAEVMKLVKYAPNGSVWVVEGAEPAYQYIFPERSIMKSNRILTE